MTTTGYWVECVPVTELQENINKKETGHEENYNAKISSIPEANVYGNSPEMAIDKLRRKLKHLKSYYKLLEKPLPKSHNPIRPPRRSRDIPGWISVYMEL